MIGMYLKIVIGLIIGFGIVAAVLTLGFIVLIGVAVAGAGLLLWYRIKFAFTPASSSSPMPDGRGEDVLEVEYEVVKTVREKRAQE